VYGDKLVDRGGQAEQQRDDVIQSEHPTTHWLDHLLDLTERAGSFTANSTLIVTVVTTSVLSSYLFAILFHPLLGLAPDEGHFTLVFIISSIVPVVVGVPSVLFADALITKTKRMRHEMSDALTEARVASRAKSEFLANISHEIRTPMNGVLGMAQVLEETELTENQREKLRLIRESGDLLMAIIDDVLDLSRIEAGRVDLNPVAQPLVTVLGDTVALFRARADEQNTCLHFISDPDVPEIMLFDSVRVRQCLGNLVSNAVKFTQNGEVEVTLSAQPADSGIWAVEISVKDTGIGITAEGQSRLFEAFSQATIKTLSDYGGTGLGLAISRRLARVMGGDITLSSVPGEGTTFVFRFLAKSAPDVADDLAAAAAMSEEPSGALQGLSILVVDDCDINRLVAQGLLEPLGVDCHLAESGVTALDILSQHPVDLVLMDMQMPDMDGEATLRAIRASGKQWAAVPVVSLTANAMQGEREACLAMGMQGYVTKPVRLPVLQAEILHALQVTQRLARKVG